MSNNVHVVGCGTIGSALVSLFCKFKKELGIDQVSFHKQTSTKNVPNVEQLVKMGAIFSGPAINNASVVVDATPKGVGLLNKENLYNKLKTSVKGFVAQGSESGFGKPFAYKINNEAITKNDQFVQVVSCNTHNICAILKVFEPNAVNADFVCIRRASDVSQDEDFVAGLEVDKHKDSVTGTHHAQDALNVFKTLGVLSGTRLSSVFSSSCVMPSQYMHCIRFKVKVSDYLSKDEFLKKLTTTGLIAVTEKNSTNSVFSFGRDYGCFGRILNQTVLPLLSLNVFNDLGGYESLTTVTGFCFTSQDGNSLLSSVAATLWHLYQDWNEVEQRMKCFESYLFSEI